MANINAGLIGGEKEVPAHVVEGRTPFLLSARWLYDMEATINFRSGKACFAALSPEQVQLERGPSFHLLMPLNMYAGNSSDLANFVVKHEERDTKVSELSNEVSDRNTGISPVPR